MTARVAVAALVAWWSVPGSAWAEGPWTHPVAIVTEVDGSVHVVAHARTVSPEVADPVEADALVVVERDARIVLVYPEAGSIYELRGPGRFVARADAVESRAGPGLVAKRDLVSALRALRIRPEGTTLQGSTAMRGANSLELQADGPTGSQFGSDAIRLCWRPMGAQWRYRVRLIDDDGVVRYDAQTRDAGFELPAAFRLEPNTEYLWHVVAKGPNGRSAEAAGQFRRLDVDSEQALLRAESAVRDLDATGRALVRIALRQHGFVPGGGGSGCSRDRSGSPLSAWNSAASR